MRTNPFLDALSFLTGQASSHDAIGSWRYLFALFSVGLVLASLAIAWTAWRRDPGQQSARNIVLWLSRALIGAMWLEGSLWKLPPPGGLGYWLGLMGKNAAFDWYGAVIQTVLLPNVVLIGIVIWLTETALAAALMLGFAVRLAGLLGIAMALNLWIGLYHYQPEWPWIYVFIAILHALFIADRAGRALGLDAVAGPAIRARDSLFSRLYRLAS